MKFGCHISIRQGYLGAAKTALALGGDAFQYFPKNPRSLNVKQVPLTDAGACAEFCREKGIRSIAHTPYPTNLAAEPGTMRQATVESLRNDLEIADACGSVGAVVHFGKYRGLDPLQGYKNIIQCVNEVLSDYKGSALLLIENQAGEGSLMGTTLEEHVQVRKLCDRPELVGFCLDTCHAFACGLWPVEKDGWLRLEDAMQRTGYWDALQAVHMNDSLYPGGACKDRHAMIGRGEIGAIRFAQLLGSKRLHAKADLPLVLETPVVRGTTHAAEIHYIKELSMR